ncbi:hypothetical protein AHF37_07900 [Paragonimus kellicotti]|nr:hypothetical protein AHF37_07900 [Paragonimus kellicotti]
MLKLYHKIRWSSYLSYIFELCLVKQECLDSVTEAWGVKVERVEIKDVRLPIQLQRAMAAEAESVREATAKVIAAEGEMRASGALKAAAFEINQHPIAMQLRYLQAMNSISSGKESTIVFPVPLDLFSFFRTHCDNTDSKELTVADGKKLLEKLRLSLEDLQIRSELQKDLNEDYFSHDQLDASTLIECLDSVTEAWGVKVERVEIKDVRLPIQLQRAMAAEAESVREATAKVIAAEGEMRASGALKAAAFEINQHPNRHATSVLASHEQHLIGQRIHHCFPGSVRFVLLFPNAL